MSSFTLCILAFLFLVENSSGKICLRKPTIFSFRSLSRTLLDHVVTMQHLPLSEDRVINSPSISFVSDSIQRIDLRSMNNSSGMGCFAVCFSSCFCSAIFNFFLCRLDNLGRLDGWAIAPSLDSSDALFLLEFFFFILGLGKLLIGYPCVWIV